MDMQLRACLAAFAESLQGPLGMIPLDRAIRADLALFQRLKATGATWVQIANALAIAGVRKPNGNLLSADHLRSTVSRQLKRSIKEKELRGCEDACAKHPNPSLVPKKLSSSTRSKRPGVDHSVDTSTNNQTMNKDNSLVLQKLARTRKLREI